MKEDRKIKNLLQVYMQWPLVLSVLVVCAAVSVSLVNGQAGALMAFFSLLYLVAAAWIFWSGKKKIQTSLISFAADYSQTQKELMESMDLPYGIADLDGKFLWMNHSLTAILKAEKSVHRHLVILFDEITPETLQQMDTSLEVESSYGESRYRICIKKVQIGHSADFLNEHGRFNGKEEV